MIEIIDGQEFEEKAVQVDGKYFYKCKFTRCTIVYEGGETNSIECQYTDCKFAFAGPAGRTVGMLVGMGWRPANGSDLVSGIAMPMKVM